ncbi:MAG: FAD/NAD(P)-binding oxidoreductase [Tepidisphaeraceae bacterium]
MSEPADHFEIVIVGSGPGGIAAAVTAAEAGRRVAIIDDSPFPGGQIWRNRGEKSKDAQARHWIDRLQAAGEKIVRLAQSRVIANPAQNVLLVETPAGPRTVQWDSLILATGARELFLPFPGWTLPGVVGAGGIQALVKQGLPVRGKRIVVAGTGPLLFAVADLMKSSGAIVPMILEQTPAAKVNRFGLSLLKTPSKLLMAVAIRARLLGTTYATDSYPTAVTKTATGLRVDFIRNDRAQSIECDYLACGFDLIPNNEIAQLLGCAVNDRGFAVVDSRQLTSVPSIYAIGELTGIGGVDKAILEGRIAVNAINGNAAAVQQMAGEHKDALAFVDRLATTFALRPEVLKLAKPDTIVCRCEDVCYSAVANAFSNRDAKLQTRCGMGVCQGRVCGPALRRIRGGEPAQVRPPVFVTSVGNLIRPVETEAHTT